MKKLFVGQLSYSTTEDSLQSLFADFGQIQSIKIITDPQTGRSRGFAFVELVDDAQADAAVSTLDGKSLDGRELVVSEARPQGERSSGGGRSFSRDRAPYNSGGGGGGGRSGGNRRSEGGNRY